MSTPTVSIIMPVYNAGSFITKTIQSLQKQTYTNWELVVIDDGSTDCSSEVVKSFNDRRISYYYQKNKGVMKLAETLNAGLSKINGELVTMLPSDDLWPEDRLASQVPVFNDPGVVLCYGKQELINIDDEVIGRTMKPKKSYSLTNSPVGSALKEMFLWNYIPQPTVLIRTETLKSIGGYLQPDGLYAEDYPTHMALALKGKFKYINKILAYYRLHPNQMTRTHYLKMAETDANYVISFYVQLTDEQKKQTGWTIKRLRKAMERRKYGAYFIVGRQHLVNKNWNDAYKYFIKAVLHGTFKERIKSLLGIACALLRVDMEWLASLSKRTAPLK